MWDGANSYGIKQTEKQSSECLGKGGSRACRFRWEVGEALRESRQEVGGPKPADTRGSTADRGKGKGTGSEAAACPEREPSDTLVKDLIFFFFQSMSFFKIFSYLFIWLLWVFVAAHGLSLVAASGGYSSLRCAGFSLRWLLLLRSTGSRRMGLSSCSTCGLSSCGSQALECRFSCSTACGIFPDQGWNPVPRVGRRILNHCNTREVPRIWFLS